MSCSIMDIGTYILFRLSGIVMVTVSPTAARMAGMFLSLAISWMRIRLTWVSTYSF